MKMNVSRRKFLSSTGASAAALTLSSLSPGLLKAGQNNGQPNFLVIITDELAQRACGAYGNTFVNMPNLDSIANNGVRFSKAYTACPLCQPTRASFWTSRYPHETKVRTNQGGERIPGSMPTLGSLFKAAGYNTQHFGKTHDAGSLKGFTIASNTKSSYTDSKGFNISYDTKKDVTAKNKCITFLNKTHTKPFLAVLDMHNPHNICGYVGSNAGRSTSNNIPHIPDSELPPLPDNFEVTDWDTRPIPIQFRCCAHKRLWQGLKWSDRNYRHYIYAYYHYVNIADTMVGEVLTALNASDAADNTVIIHFADHGEGMGCHRMITKHGGFYEEEARVPFSAMGPGIVDTGLEVTEPLVSTLDLLPTLCDIANITPPSVVRGKSLKPWLEGDSTEDQHEFIVSHWHGEYNTMNHSSGGKYVVTTPGRMIRTHQFKYVKFIEGNGEELYDLEHDPGEMTNLAPDSAYAAVLQQHRDLLARYIQETGDDFESLTPNVAPIMRGHKSNNTGSGIHNLGYENHYGPHVDIDPAVQGNAPAKIGLSTYPNPFNSRVRIEYTLNRPDNVRAEVFDIRGRKIRTLVSGTRKSGGTHQLFWDAKDNHGVDLSSGQYIIRLAGETFVKSSKITLAR